MEKKNEIRKREILGVVDDGWDDPVIEMDRFFSGTRELLLLPFQSLSSRIQLIITMMMIIYAVMLDV